MAERIVPRSWFTAKPGKLVIWHPGKPLSAVDVRSRFSACRTQWMSSLST